MIRKLASIKLTFFSLVLLLAALGAGTGLTYMPAHAKTIRRISETLPLDWMISAGRDDVVVLAWFLVTCLFSVVLFLNVMACTGLRVAVVLQNRKSTRQWLFVIIHVMFAAVMLCHGLGMVLGFKHSRIELWPGDRYPFENGYGINLTAVTFGDDTEMLKADYQTRRSLMTRERFHPEQNTAHVMLTFKDEAIASGNVHILSPMTADGIQITITDFLYRQEAEKNPVGVSLVVAKNPVTPVFFISYILLILSLIGFLAVTRKPAANGKG